MNEWNFLLLLIVHISVQYFASCFQTFETAQQQNSRPRIRILEILFYVTYKQEVLDSISAFHQAVLC